MAKDVEMKDQTNEKDQNEKPQGPTTQQALKSNISLIQKAVSMKDARLLIGRALRQTAAIRKNLESSELLQFLESQLPLGHLSMITLQQHLKQKVNNKQQQPDTSDILPEIEMYCNLLVVLFLVDAKDFTTARSLCEQAVTKLHDINRRTLDMIASRIYFYYSYSSEKTNTLAQIRSTLLKLHRTAVLRHDEIGQEVLLNLLLRNYLQFNLYEQADKLRARSQRPETRSNQQQCRYLYYLGRIRAVQLDYAEAKDSLQQAMRKAPSVARGFRIAVSKWLIPVRLLLGEIPDRMEFSQPHIMQALLPYFKLTQAVRSGDLKSFGEVASTYNSVFTADGVHNLIDRLHRNVIRTGLRRIALSYSKISLQDIAVKVGLPSVLDTEYIVAKAIRDGGMNADIDHANGYVIMHDVLDMYSTNAPAAAYHDRIAFCIDVHNEAVKAMRYEPNDSKSAYEDADARKERLAAEQEIARSITEDGEGF